jgi:bifunctional non-homologous end joining protein LigD
VKKRISLDQEFVIGGYTPPQGGRTHFGALLVGYHEKGKLLYAGKVGTGFNARLLAQLHARFESLRTADCPFDNLPMPRRPQFGTGATAAALRDVTWLEPKLVCQVKFSEWTREGILRQPVFLGLREDKKAGEVVREISER